MQAKSTTLPLQDGAAKYTYTLSEDAKTCQIVIKDSSGAVVKTEQGQLTAGTYHMTWDGKNSYGEQLEDGAYTLEVQASAADDGKTVENIYTTTFGKVTAVANDGDDVLIAAGPVLFGMSYIISVRNLETASTGTGTNTETGTETTTGTDASTDTGTTTTETETNG